MAYSSNGRLPYELASKIGHIDVIKSEWVQSILSDFHTDDLMNSENYKMEIWQDFNPKSAVPLAHIWVADGTYKPSENNHKQVVFVKTGLLTIEQNKITAVDKQNPHPFQIIPIIKDNACFTHTVFPLKNIKTPYGNIYDSVRHVIFDSMKHDEGGQFFDTLKWIAYRKWEKEPHRSPAFECPACNHKIEEGLAFDLEKGICPHCGKEVFLTDMLGFHLDMNDYCASDNVARSYMLIMETLMLFTIIKLHWMNPDKSIVSNTLYIKDGPLMLPGQYAKIVPHIRDFLGYAKAQNRPVHLIGCEKSGYCFDHLTLASKFVNFKNDCDIKYAILNHDYIRQQVQRTNDRIHPYGQRTNYGEKCFVCLNQHTHIVLNVTTGDYKEDGTYPTEDDIIGLPRILATLPSLISRRHEGALYPIELINNIVSLSDSPSAKILDNFVADALR